MFDFKKYAALQHIKKCINCIASLHNHLVKKIYKQIFIAISNEVEKRQKSSQNYNAGSSCKCSKKELRYLSDRDLEDMGKSLCTVVYGVVESVIADIDAHVADQLMLKIIQTVINPNLVGAV